MTEPTATAPPPSLTDVATDLMGQSKPELLRQVLTSGKERATAIETGAKTQEKEAADITALAREQETARDKARPVKPELTPPPSTAARAFLEPGPGILAQLQTVIQGMGLVALGMAGAKGTGYALSLIHI